MYDPQFMLFFARKCAEIVDRTYEGVGGGGGGGSCCMNKKNQRWKEGGVENGNFKPTNLRMSPSSISLVTSTCSVCEV